jgi:phospholipid-translocating ATPase
MLTGDKVETATCIALSAGFKSRHQQLFFIRDCISKREVEAELDRFGQAGPEKLVLMIDGQSLDQILVQSSPAASSNITQERA